MFIPLVTPLGPVSIVPPPMPICRERRRCDMASGCLTSCGGGVGGGIFGVDMHIVGILTRAECCSRVCGHHLHRRHHHQIRRPTRHRPTHRRAWCFVSGRRSCAERPRPLAQMRAIHRLHQLAWRQRSRSLGWSRLSTCDRIVDALSADTDTLHAGHWVEPGHHRQVVGQAHAALARRLAQQAALLAHRERERQRQGIAQVG